MRKTIIIVSVATIIAFSFTLTGVQVKAADDASKLEELNDQKSELDNKRSTIKSKIIDADQKINRLQEDQLKVNEEIKRLDFAINDSEQKVIKKQEEINVTEEEIAKLKEQIKIIQERIEKRNELLKNRARSFQENGSMVSYLDVLLGAMSFSDFIDRFGAVATIVEADQDILREHSEDKSLLETSQREVEKKLKNLQTMLDDLENLIKSLNSQKAEKDKIMMSLKMEEEDIEKYKMELGEEDQLLSSQQSVMQKAIQLEQQRKAKQARNNSGGGGGASVSSPPVSSGNFTSPTSGTLTSGFGSRSGGTHYGVDIAKRGTVPVVAAADGVVMRSYYSSSYGNVVFISHSIDGQIYTTVYAHMNSRTVSAGQAVSKGQQVGYQGNTGQSFGQHLHFELHKGPWNAGKTNAINPVGIVPL
ncbi:peptidoglycan DD-metalloendopeptidase family protein (plasmid) [Cytobacillus firmus]|uniref:murein hydrolase activator EnvC family protein n=1 Tax=Bacillaceae TaxID=186817 RepID=UPI001A8D0EC1|nr:peptidoglycan DD-metalloendopeptidase family protein [Bacillus sp. NTK034]MBN8202791.1 peptidoglycan DD-metalloendopeptidase family protein [Bacillus sp. NTK034]